MVEELVFAGQDILGDETFFLAAQLYVFAELEEFEWWWRASSQG